MDAELDLLKSIPRKSRSVLPKTHSQVTAPMLARDALNVCYQDNWTNAFPQRGLLGSVLSVNRRGLAQNSKDPRIYINLDAPSSGLICGVQVYAFPNAYVGMGLIPLRGRAKVILYHAFSRHPW